MNNTGGTDRFPVPDKWILKQLPEGLHSLFGPRGKPEFDFDSISDQIYYTYTVGLPDGNAMKKALFAHYVNEGGPAVSFTVGDETELEGIRFVVQSWTRDEVLPRGDARGYMIHQVDLKLADQ